MHRRLSGLRPRLILLVLLAVAPAVGLLSYSAARERDAAREAAEASAFATARLLSVQQDDLIANARDLLSALAALPSVRDRDTSRCNASLAALNERYSGYTGFWADRLDGDPFCSSSLLPPGFTNAGQAWFQEMVASRSFTVSSYKIGRMTGRASITLALPLFDAEGNLDGGMMTAIDLAWLSNRLERTPIPAGATVTIVDQAGTIMARYPDGAAWLGKPYAEAAVVRAMHEHDAGTLETTGPDGIARLYGYNRLGNASTGVFVSIGVPAALAYAESNAAYRRDLLLLAVAALAALAAAWFGADLFVLRQVRALARGAQKLGAGVSGVRIAPLPGGGELAALARDFDKMATALDARTRELQANEARFRALVQNGSDIILVFDPQRVIRYISPSVQRILGYLPEEVEGRSLLEFVHPEDSSLMRKRAQGAEVPRQLQVDLRRFRHKDGSWRFMESHTTNMLDDRAVRGIVSNARDVTDRVLMQEQLERQAAELHELSLTDELTGLTNRRGFMTLADQCVRAAHRTDQSVMLMFADLDGLKSINDTFGHQAGDAAIAEAALILRTTFRESDIVARLGGDEFAVLSLVNPAEPAADLAARLHRAVATHNARPDTRVPLSLSVGVARAEPSRSMSLEGLIAEADTRMYLEKREHASRAAWSVG